MVFIRPLLFLPLSIVFFLVVSCELFYINDDLSKVPIVDISVLVRNKEHTLPYFLSCLRRLDYPKRRIYLWIYSDYSSDSSEKIIAEWLKKHEDEYGAVFVTMDSKDTGYEHPDETGTEQWSQKHIEHVIELREQALEFSRIIRADYLFMIDADVYLTNPDTLTELILKDLDICAPMLQTDGYYSNFWCGMTEKYYYKRTEEYSRILFRVVSGCFPVPMVHSCVLINLKSTQSKSLTYSPKNAKNYDGPTDDVITFAVNAKNIGMELYICNDISYGSTQTPPAKDKNYIDVEKQNLLNLKMESISSGSPLPLDDDLEIYIQYPSPGNYGLDQTFVLNLERRPERRRLMELSLKELGLRYKLFKAIDFHELNEDMFMRLGIRIMDKYEDPYYKRPIKLGEVGCFLSHYYIWKKVVQKGYQKVLVLEDDIRFVPNFKAEFNKLMDEIDYLPDWDFVYLGRKILFDDEVAEGQRLVRPRYSYWTLGYIISARGAQKLLDAKPLGNLLPVDEFIPIMFDEHPNATWKTQFEKRNLVAFSASPLLVYPTHFTGQEGYISDTEESTIHTTPAPIVYDVDQENIQTITIHVHSFMGFGEGDPLNIDARFYDPKVSNESWYKSWNYKLHKTEL